MKTSVTYRNLMICSFIVLLAVSTACEKINGGGSTQNSNFETAIQTGKPIAKVGSTEIREGYFDVVGNINPQVKMRLSTPTGRKQVLDNLIDQELLYNASLANHLENDPAVKERIGFYTRAIIGQAYLENEMKKRAEEYYNTHKKEEFEQVQLAHLYVKFEKNPEATPPSPSKPETPAEAPKEEALDAKKQAAMTTIQGLEKRLKDGTDFAALVQESSDDALTKKSGGTLGWIGRNDQRLARKNWKPLIDKAFTMKAGEVSSIIETEKGYHIIKVLDGPKELPFNEVEPRIRANFGGSVRKEILTALKKSTPVEILDKALDTGNNAASGEAPKASPLPHGAPEVPAPQTTAPTAPTPEAPKVESAPVAAPQANEPTAPQSKPASEGPKTE